ncbi:MAG: hypothetical protein ACNS63_11290 [Candidatus Nitrospinota bacterium M3_3B_026]
MKNRTVFFLAVSLLLAACSGGEPKTDLPQEMAAQQAVADIKLLVKRGKMDEAQKAMAQLEKKYGHTKTYSENKADLLREGLASENQDIVLTGKRLIELENSLIAFYRESGEWPAPGQIYKPLDAWGNETYWIIGTERTNYDLVVVSSGADGKPGSGDELMVVWAEEDLSGYKDKRTGKMVGKTRKSKKKKQKKTGAEQVMTLGELNALEKESGTRPEELLSLDELAAMGEKSRKAGQPRKNEMVLSLDEIRSNLK